MQVWRPAVLLKRLQHRCFYVKFAKFLRALTLENICDWLPLGLVFSFLSWRLSWIFLNGKSSSEFSVNGGVPLGPILGTVLLLLLHINVLPDNINCKTLYCKCDQASDVVQQLDLNLNLTLCAGLGRDLLISVLGKLVSFDRLLLIWKCMGVSLTKNHLWRCWNSVFLSLNWMGLSHCLNC